MTIHVGLNLLFVEPGRTGGMEVVAHDLVAAVAAARPDARLTVFVGREAAGWPLPVERRVLPVHARHRVGRVAAEQSLLPLAAARIGCDVVHSLGSTGPLAGRFARVLTVYDLAFLHAPDAHSRVRGTGMKVIVPASARRAHVVLAPSEHTRAELVDELRLPAERVTVVPPGVPTRPGPTRGPRFPGRPVLLCLSGGGRHKGWPQLVEALSKIGGRPLLVVTGCTPGERADLAALAETQGVAADVVGLPWLSDGEVSSLLAEAVALVVPSTYEGFGLPVLEAMQAGVPVACSNRAALPEVAGGCALLFDPLEPDDIAAAILEILRPDRVAARVEAGREHAASYSWERAAAQTWDAYERAVRLRSASRTS